MQITASSFFDGEGLFAVTERLVLRAPSANDIVALDEGFNGAYRGRDNRRRLQRRALFERWGRATDDENMLCCVIAERGSDLVCGCCNIKKLDQEPLELGIVLLPSFQRRGIGTEAMGAFMEGAEAVCAPVAFRAQIRPGNARAQRMARKLGFEPVGVEPIPNLRNETVREIFEREHDSDIDVCLTELASEFGVEPRKLLAHVLVFWKRAGLFRVA